MKRMLSILLALCMLLSMIPTVLADGGTEITGTELTWSFDETTGTLSIEGTGAMPAWSNGNAVPWRSYKSKIVNVEIAEGITTVGPYAFNAHSALECIMIPDSVTSIGKQAFYGCTGLLTAALGSNLVSIGEKAFGNCSELTVVSIGEGITEIAEETFLYSNNISRIFYEGTKSEWENINVERNNGSIYGYDADEVLCMDPYGTGISQDVVWTFDPMTFTLSFEGEGAMDDYDDADREWYEYRDVIRTVRIADGVTNIGTTAFRYFGMLKTVEIPASVTAVHENAFAYCKVLKDVYYGSSEGDWAAVVIGSGNDYLKAATVHYAEECAHTNTEEKITSNGDETHSKKVVCSCGEILSEGEAEPCVDITGDKKCEVCGGDVAETTQCEHGEAYVTSTATSNGDDTHTINAHCSLCDKDLEPVKAPCYDSDEDGKCDLCKGDYIGECDGTNHPRARAVYNPNNKEADVNYTHTVVMFCDECNMEVGEAWIEPCTDGDDEDTLCDDCKVGTPCTHENCETRTEIICNEDNTHTTYTYCMTCTALIGEEDAECADENKNAVCDVCEGDIEGIFWDLTDGVLTIYGKGAMEDYASMSGMPWANVRDDITEIVIAEGVTHIGVRAFYRCANVTKVSIASTVESIGDYAFYRCEKLTTVNYSGTESEWTALTKKTGSSNGSLLNAKIEALCDHETTETVTANADKTHTVTEVCGKCGETVRSETADCAGEPVYTNTEAGKHTVTVNCSVCEQLLSSEEVACEGESVSTPNGDRTHTTVTTCADCGKVISTETVKCVDGEDEDELCDICGADLHCDHPETTKVITSDAEAKTHTVTEVCNTCEKVLSETTTDCAGENVYAATETGKHKETVNCAVCSQLISETEGECTPTAATEDNGNRTHTVITTCRDCEQTLDETVVPCEDGEDEDELCDICGANLHCDHPGYLPAYTPNNDHETHMYAFYCTVCGAEYEELGQELKCVDEDGNDICDKCGQDVSCQHKETKETIDYIVNDDRTHTVVTVTTCTVEGCGAEVSRVPAETATPCTDVDDDDYCDICEADLTCGHDVQDINYICHKNWTHTMQIFCETCGDRLAEDGPVTCVDRRNNETGAVVADGDGLCDICGGACEHNYEVSYEIKDDETHVKVETCTYEGCGDVVRTNEACKDTDVHDGKCDGCGNDVECPHIKKTEYKPNNDGTHDIVETCSVCGAESACPTCTAFIKTTEDAACVDANHDQKCEICKGTVACVDHGEFTYTSDGNGKHSKVCGYCDAIIETVACEDNNDDCLCDENCGYSFAVATTGETAFFKTLELAVTNVAVGGTVTLLKDVELTETLSIGKTMTLDLGEKTLTGSIHVTGGDVTVRNGKIEGKGDAIILGTKNQTKETLTVTLEESLTVHSATDCAVLLYDGTLNSAAKLSAAGTYAVLQGSGRDYGAANITGGSVTHEGELAIYWPQDDKLTISGGTVTGATAVYVKGGEAEISGEAKLIATGDKAEFDPSDNGASATGEALVVENCDYPGAPPVVTVTGGTFTSRKAEAVGSYKCRTKDEAVATFEIKGGTFSSDVSEHCAEGYECKADGSVWVVSEITQCEHVDEDKDTYCDTCGEQFVELETVTIAGANMTLGNALEINIMIETNQLSGEGYSMRITQEGKDPVIKPISEVVGIYYRVPWRVTAKEMADDLAIEVLNADGYVVNEPYTDSVRAYSARALSNSQSNAETKTLVVDMVNYGAAAQAYFNYNEEDPANNLLTEEQAAYATGEVTCTNNQVKGTNCMGANLTLNDCILMNIFFGGFAGKDVDSMYAEISLTNYLGEEVTATVAGSDFIPYEEVANSYKVEVDEIVLADAFCDVTVTVYNADGTVHGTATDSVESYIARASATDALYETIIKFAFSAREYFT